MAKLVTRIKYIHVFIKAGQTYVYFRKGGVKKRIRRDAADAAGIKQDVAAILLEIAQGAQAPEPSHPPGTLGAAIEAYKAADHWRNELSPDTRKSYERAFANLDRLSDRPLDWLTRPRILRLRDEAWMPKFKRWMANYMVTVLGVVLRFALDRGDLRANPLADKVTRIRRRKGEALRNRRWTDEERRAVLEEALPEVRLPLALFMCTGLRKRDIFTATMADIRDGDINVVTSKRDMPVAIPLHAYVVEALAKRPGPAVGKIVVRKNGKPYTADGFDTIWHRFRTRLEAEGKIGKGLTLHGLRHTLGTMLKEAGLSDGAIADVLAQSSVSMARHYSRNARLPDETRAKIVALDMGKR